MNKILIYTSGIGGANFNLGFILNTSAGTATSAAIPVSGS